MCTIRVAEILQDKTFLDARNCLYSMFVKNIHESKIILDFTEVSSLPSLFLNVSIGAFIDNYGVELLKKKVSFIHITKQQAERIKLYVNQYVALFVSKYSYVTDCLGHDARYAIDSTKLQKEIGWEPSIQFEKGVEKTVRLYLDNQDWLEHITSGEYEKYYEEMYSKR